MVYGWNYSVYFGSVMIDDKDAINSLKKVDDKGKSTGQKFADVAKKGALIGAAVGGAAIAAGGALYGMATNAAGVADNVHKASQRMGVTTDAYQEMDFWASQNGLSQGNMEKALGRLNQRLGEAADGNEKYSGALEKLGVNMDDVRAGTLSTEDAFVTSIQSLSEMENGQEQAALASELFGTKLGRELLPALQDGALSIEDAKEQAHALGIVLDEDAIGAGVNFTDTMDQMKRSLGAVATNIGVEVMPIIQKMLDWVIANMPQIQSVMSTVFSVISSVVTTAVDIFTNYLLPAFTFVYDWVQAHMPQIKETVGQVFDGIRTFWENNLRPVFDALINVVNLVWDIFKVAWPHIMTVVGVAFDYIKLIWDSILQPTLAFIVDTINKLVGIFQKHMPAIQQTFQIMAEAIQGYYNNIIKPAIESIARIIAWMRDKFTEYILPLVDRVIGWFTNLTSGIKEKMDTGAENVNKAIEKIRGFFDKVSAMKDTLIGHFESIRAGIKEKIDAARDAVSTAIEKIKGFFDFKFKLPSIPKPSFGISPSGWKMGDLLKGTIPKLDINWNAAGGIFDSPTIFNTSRGLQGVGEAGPEAIMPLSKLESMLNLNNDKKGNEVIVNVNIDTFNNESDRDINSLAEKLAFETNRRLAGGGIGFA